jgi:phosphoglycerate dehydrogenase-like enzyme
MSLLATRKKTNPALAATADAAQQRVLFAFSKGDRALFFPSHVDAFPDGPGERQWFNTDTLKSLQHWEEYLLEYRPTVLVSCWSTPRIPDSVLFADSMRLRYLCHSAGTVRSKVPREFITAGGMVTNWGQTISHTVAEHGLLLVLASLRRMTCWKESLEPKNVLWGNAQLMQTKSLREKRVGIHGFGNVACQLIHLLEPFSVECRAYSENVPPAIMRQKGVIPCDSLEELFSQSEIIVECEALTAHSAGSVTEKLLRLLPPDAVFVNIARGGLVDERALERCAVEGRLRIALDVFSQEPLSEESLLRAGEDVILSPHIAGPTSDWFYRCGDQALKNLEAYLKGGALNGLVTVEVYDRST